MDLCYFKYKAKFLKRTLTIMVNKNILFFFFLIFTNLDFKSAKRHVYVYPIRKFILMPNYVETY